jgi:uncharacterized protein DUF4395
MRPSKTDFMRQQGFTTEGCHDGLYSALMFQPRVIAGVVISGVVLQSPWLFLALSTVLWWSALVPRHNPFDAFFNYVMADPMRLAAMPAAPPPRRFSQAVAGTFAMSISMALFTGASHAAWPIEGVFVAGSMSVAVRRFCLPAYVYHLLWSRTPATPCPSSPGRV